MNLLAIQKFFFLFYHWASITFDSLVSRFPASTNQPQLPNYELNQKWWGLYENNDNDTSIREFNIDFNNEMVADLKSRLRNTYFLQDPLFVNKSLYGVNTEYLKEVLSYWQGEYNFTERAEYINKFPHYKTNIQGLDIHFIRAKPVSTHKQVLPLLMLHGWPSSSREFFEVIPYLTGHKNTFEAKHNFVFEVIAADLPGFGYSEASAKPGLDAVQVAIIMNNLMKRLGYDQYVVHAGDWGSQVATHMATIFQNNIIGYHNTMAWSSMPSSMLRSFMESVHAAGDPKGKTASSIFNVIFYILKEFGYFHMQATKPDTLGVALGDSPAGLAAYLIQVMSMATNPTQTDTYHGGLGSLNTTDVLDTVTIMWDSKHITTSMRFYAENMKSDDARTVHRFSTNVPTAALQFKHEVLYQPRHILEEKFKNLRVERKDFGGHFSGLENPDVLAEDICESADFFIKTSPLMKSNIK